VKSQLHLILQECAVISAVNCGTNWHNVVKQKSISAEEHEVCDFQSNLLRHAILFFGDVGACHSTFYHFS
jgi:hypothetical protein